ncbi:MAG: hypothetical protein JNJ40_09040 [Bacteroidia bacterium]|nr:hypothetical protein [Bacteroidia bacterium]
MKHQCLTFLLATTLILTNSKTLAQTVIKFIDQSCKENCDAIKSLSSGTTNKDIFLNFSIEGIKKIALKPSEVLMVEFNFYDESSSFEKINILAKQNDKGLIIGESILLPSSISSSIEVNTIYNNEFNYKIIERLKSQNGGSLKLHIEKYSIRVYDIIKKQQVTMDYGVQQEDLERFKQFINIGTSFEIKKHPTLKINCESGYKFDEISSKIENEIKLKNEKLYQDLANNTPAPQEYKLNNFNGIGNEISKEVASKVISEYFGESKYKVLKISKSSNEIEIEKELNGIPKYKWFYIKVYIQGPKGNCGYAPVTMKSIYLGNGKYGDWKVDVYKYTACTCE